MTYLGHVRDNMIVLDEDIMLPEGTEVRIEPVTADEQPNAGESLLKRLGDLVGSIHDLPEDFAANHDHYIHGTPKR